MNDQLISIAIQEAPAAIALVRALFVKRHPTDPVPTDEEIIGAYQSALASSLAKDAAWLAAHPKQP